MTTAPDLVVLGGGIVGLTSALAAANRGMRVTVIDQLRPGASSRASAGILAPSVDGLPRPALAAAWAARDFYPGFLEALAEVTELEVPLDRSGVLELASSPEELEKLAGRAPTSTRLDAAALAGLEPAFAGHAGALMHPHDGGVDVVALMSALDVAIAIHPRVARVTDEVASLDARGNLPAFRSRGGTRYAGRRLLLASGAWAGALPGLPRAIPVRPVRGQLIRLEGPSIRHTTFGGGGYLVRRNGALLVGATSEETGFDSNTTPRGLKELRAIATRAIPGLAKANLVEHWAALRPMSGDGFPILGADPSLPALFYACGFSRNGILLAPWAADRLAQALAGGSAAEVLAPFRVERFEENPITL
ncbi:MAG: NAD(P)/FAD-dependent oxidoreductase [Gemmatimonadaceae bacterium]